MYDAFRLGIEKNNEVEPDYDIVLQSKRQKKGIILKESCQKEKMKIKFQLILRIKNRYEQAHLKKEWIN